LHRRQGHNGRECNDVHIGYFIEMSTSCPGTAVRIVVADDFPPVREALRKLFGEFAALEVVGEAADGNSAIEVALHLVPEVIVMDVKMPHLGGVEATKRIKQVLPEIHVVGFSSQDDTVTREAMTTAGCSAFITKECAHALPDVIGMITGRPVAHVSFEGSF
jgi:DNA-binding NarL/FixJ family response regulator